MTKLFVSIVLLCFVVGLFSVPPKSNLGIVGIRCHGHFPPSVFIYRVQSGTPAMHAGIEAGDRLIAIDGQKIHSDTKHKVRPLLVGPPGSAVTIEVERAGERLQFTMKRAGLSELQNEDAQVLYREIEESQRRSEETQKARHSIDVFGGYQ
jgi:Periplasmic protease